MNPTNRIDHRPGLAITADALTRRYGDVWALSDATFSVDYGSTFALLGRNGSGKTTTVRLLTTLTTPTSGHARVAGYDIVGAAAAVRRSIGVTMQSTALDPEMTGREHLELICGAWGDSRRQARDHANELLTEFGLTGAADRLIGTYSGGMKRRIDIAGALANAPKILFLDEPTTGLDAQSRRALWDRVNGLREAGAAIFLTTQYLEEADNLADVVAVLDNGRIIAHGSPSELKARFSTTTVRLRTSRPDDLTHLSGSERAEVEGNGWIRIDTSTAARAIDLVGSLSHDITDVSISPPSLEDAYLSLTGDAVERTANDLTRNSA